MNEQILAKALKNVATTNPRAIAATPFQSFTWQDKWLRIDRKNPHVQRAANEAQAFCGRFFQNKGPRRLVLQGPPCTGKTHLAEACNQYAQAVALEAWLRGNWPYKPRALFVQWALICMKKSHEFAEWLEMLNEPKIDLLFLEDIGSETDQFKSAMPTLNLQCVLDAFKNRYVFITTNVPPNLWSSKWDARVASRLERDTVRVELNIPAYKKS